MIPTASPIATPSLPDTAVRIVPKIFWMMTLEARNSVMMTDDTRNTFAQPGCGEDDMNCGSLRQRRRQMEKKGSRQPLKVWATKTTSVRSAEKLKHFQMNIVFTCYLPFALIIAVEITTSIKMIPKYMDQGSRFGSSSSKSNSTFVVWLSTRGHGGAVIG